MEGLEYMRKAILDLARGELKKHLAYLLMSGQNLSSTKGAQTLLSLSFGRTLEPGDHVIEYPEFHLPTQIILNGIDEANKLDSCSFTLLTTCPIALSWFKCDQLVIRVDCKEQEDGSVFPIDFVENPKTFYGGSISSAYSKTQGLREKYINH